MSDGEGRRSQGARRARRAKTETGGWAGAAQWRRIWAASRARRGSSTPARALEAPEGGQASEGRQAAGDLCSPLPVLSQPPGRPPAARARARRAAGRLLPTARTQPEAGSRGGGPPADRGMGLWELQSTGRTGDERAEPDGHRRLVVRARVLASRGERSWCARGEQARNERARASLLRHFSPTRGSCPSPRPPAVASSLHGGGRSPLGVRFEQRKKRGPRRAPGPRDPAERPFLGPGFALRAPWHPACLRLWRCSRRRVRAATGTQRLLLRTNSLVSVCVRRRGGCADWGEGCEECAPVPHWLGAPQGGGGPRGGSAAASRLQLC